jgi:hypothetical protein
MLYAPPTHREAPRESQCPHTDAASQPRPPPHLPSNHHVHITSAATSVRVEPQKSAAIAKTTSQSGRFVNSTGLASTEGPQALIEVVALEYLSSNLKGICDHSPRSDFL